MEEKKVRYTCPVDDCKFHSREKTELKTANGWQGHLKLTHNITGEDIPDPNDFVFEVEKSRKTPRKKEKLSDDREDDNMADDDYAEDSEKALLRGNMRKASMAIGKLPSKKRNALTPQREVLKDAMRTLSKKKVAVEKFEDLRNMFEGEWLPIIETHTGTLEPIEPEELAQGKGEEERILNLERERLRDEVAKWRRKVAKVKEAKLKDMLFGPQRLLERLDQSLATEGITERELDYVQRELNNAVIPEVNTILEKQKENTQDRTFDMERERVRDEIAKWFRKISTVEDPEIKEMLFEPKRSLDRLDKTLSNDDVSERDVDYAKRQLNSAIIPEITTVLGKINDMSDETIDIEKSQLKSFVRHYLRLINKQRDKVKTKLYPLKEELKAVNRTLSQSIDRSTLENEKFNLENDIAPQIDSILERYGKKTFDYEGEDEDMMLDIMGGSENEMKAKQRMLRMQKLDRMIEEERMQHKEIMRMKFQQGDQGRGQGTMHPETQVKVDPKSGEPLRDEEGNLIRRPSINQGRRNRGRTSTSCCFSTR